MAASDNQGISSMKRSLDISETKAEINADELRLAQMGSSNKLQPLFRVAGHTNSCNQVIPKNSIDISVP